jgi:H+/Cl- antiporter ClcA
VDSGGVGFFKPKRATTLSQLRKTEGRGKFLTYFILFSFFSVITGLIDGVLQIKPDLQPHFPAGIFTHYNGVLPLWYKLWLLLAPFVYLLILIGIWKWKRKAIYALFMYIGFEFISTFFLFPNPFLRLIALFFTIITFCIWLGVIKPKWHLFS